MMEVYISFAAVYLLTAILALFQPWFARKNVLFGVVFGSDHIWNEPEAGQIRHRYLLHAIAAAAGIGIAAVLYFTLRQPDTGAASGVFLVTTFAMLAAETAAFVAANRRTLAFKASKGNDPNLVSSRITVDTSVSEKQAVVSSAWLLFLLPIPLVTLAIALWGYGSMPDLLPTHYSFAEADAWLPKSWRVVLMPVITQVGLGLILFLTALFTRRAPASVRGNPEAAPGSVRYRRYMVLLLVFLGCIMELLFLIIVIGYFSTISTLWFNILTAFCILSLVLLFWLFIRFVRRKTPSGPIFDDDAKWVLGMFYFSRSDPSLFVEKRSGIGYTVNFARPGAWIIMAVIAVVIIVSLIQSA